MPQFDQFSFFNQVFWFFLVFFFFYLFISYYFLPRLSFNIKFRQKKINQNELYNLFFSYESKKNQKLLNNLYNYIFITFENFFKINLTKKTSKTITISTFSNFLNTYLKNYFLF